MITRPPKALALSFLLLAIVSPALAGPLSFSRISPKADWVVHLDYERFNNTGIGRFVRQKMREVGFEEKLQNFATVFSFHPIDDVRSVTLYGRGNDRDKAVAIIEGNFDEEKLIALVSMNPFYQQIEYGDAILHGWLHEEKHGEKDTSRMMYGCVYQHKLVLISSSLETIKHAVDVLSAGSAADSPPFTAPAFSTPGAFLQAAATNLEQLAAQDKKAATLRHARQLSLAIGELNDTFYLDVTLQATSPQTAQQVIKVLEGIRAFASLAAEEQPALAEIAEVVQLSCTDDVVRLSIEAPSEDVQSFLNEQWQNKLANKINQNQP